MARACLLVYFSIVKEKFHFPFDLFVSFSVMKSLLISRENVSLLLLARDILRVVVHNFNMSICIFCFMSIFSESVPYILLNYFYPYFSVVRRC